MNRELRLFGLILIVGLTVSFAAANPVQNSPASRQETVAGKKPIAFEEWYLPTDDKAAPFLYVYEIGKGETVIVLHGGPGMGHRLMSIALTWSNLMEH